MHVFQFPNHFLACGFIFEQADLEQLLADQLAVRVAQQRRHERIGVGDFARNGVDEENAVLRGFESFR